MTTTTVTLADFLLARFDEDENDARYGGEPGAVCSCPTIERRLAECDAKRRIVRDYQHDVRDYRAGYTNVQPPHKTMKHLALPYASHPDYREEFRP